MKELTNYLIVRKNATNVGESKEKRYNHILQSKNILTVNHSIYTKYY